MFERIKLTEETAMEYGDNEAVMQYDDEDAAMEYHDSDGICCFGCDF